MNLFTPSLMQATDSNGNPLSGAKWKFYLTGTSTPKEVYNASEASLGATVTADSAGRFTPIYLEDGVTYRADLTNAAGSVIIPIDPYVVATTSSATVTPQDYGAVADGVTDDSAAFVAAIAALKALAVNDDTYYKGSGKLFIPAGDYNLGTTTLDITHTLIIEGESSINGYSSRLSWSGDCDGIRIQAYNTSGAGAVDGSPHYSGSYTIIRNLGLAGPYVNQTNFTGNTEGDYHGIHARSNYIVEDVLIDGFAGDGIYSAAAVGGGVGLEGNSNHSFINRLRVTNVRNGVYLDGADANACVITGVIGTYCRQYTVWDSSFLGNTHIGHHSANAGIVRGVPSSIVSYSGNRYFVLQGQAVGASTNAPSGTTADNTYWGYLGAGAADLTLNILTWVSGVSVREGGCYKTDSGNGYSTFIGCYSEGGEAPAQFASPTLVIGGLWGSRDPLTAGNYIAGGKIVAANPATFGLTKFKNAAASATSISITHNTQTFASSLASRHGFAQGLEADGSTPALAGTIAAYHTSSSAGTAEGVVAITTRTAGGAGSQTDRLYVDGANLCVRPATDNSLDLGLGSHRWKTVYAATGAINTSDIREKQDIAALSVAEQNVATAIKGLIKKFRFKDAVEEKGNDARIHIGVMAQEVKAAFEAEGLNPARYGLFCYDEWEGGDRYGIRYEELLAFVIAAL